VADAEPGPTPGETPACLALPASSPEKLQIPVIRRQAADHRSAIVAVAPHENGRRRQMRDLLVPIFGEWGAVVAQFLLTVIIVFGLIGGVWWFVRRYSGVHFGGIGRGRVPRLAIVDVMPIDRRHRLVLVRRDNIEHLLLIGGPSDVVVEGAIQRVRQRSPQQAAQVAAARAAMQSAIDAQPEAPQLEAPQPEAAEREPAAANEPIPFPTARSAPVRQAPLQAAGSDRRFPFRALRRPPPAPEAPAEEPSGASAPAEEPPAATAAKFVEPPEPPPLQPQHVVAEAADETLLSEVMTAEADLPSARSPEAPLPATFAEAEWEIAEAARQSALDLGDVAGEAIGDSEAAAGATDEQVPLPEAAAEPQPAPPESAARVSDLEREMARLLDEITTRRTT
jgi:flagellar protein FliO/FliZ